VGGGEETEVLQAPIAFYSDWALSRSGLYYATEKVRVSEGVDFLYWARAPTEYTIRFLDFESGKVTELFRTDGLFTHYGLAVSPDEEWILYTEQPVAQAEVMLVENLHY
jgi:hypothetical protein